MNNINETEAPAAQTANTGQIGWQLRKARKISRLSVETVALQLHIDPRVIRALEEDDFSQMKPVFVRGYLRNYARLVNLPVEPLLESYNQLVGAQTPPPPPPSPSSSPPDARRGLYLLVAGLAVALFLWAGYQAYINVVATGDLQSDAGPVSSEESSPAVGDVHSAMPPAQATASAKPEGTAPSGPAGSKGPSAPAENAAPNVIPSGASQGKAAETAQPTPAATAPSPPVGQGPDSLRVQVSADAWVAIRDHAGHRLAYEIMPAGTDRSFLGQAPFALVLGNSPATRLEFNGQPFEQPKPRAGIVARFRVGQSRGTEAGTR